MQATIDVNVLKAVNLSAGTEKFRDYLNGVLLEIDAESVTYVATDGHRLMAVHRKVHERNTLTGYYILPRKDIDAIKLSKKSSPDATMTKSGADILIEYDGGKSIMKPIDGSYPDWRRVLPSKTDGTPAQYNGELLESFQKFGKLLYMGMPHLHHNGAGPAMVTFADHPEAFGVIMPLRDFNPAAPATPPLWTAPRAFPLINAA